MCPDSTRGKALVITGYPQDDTAKLLLKPSKTELALLLPGALGQHDTVGGVSFNRYLLPLGIRD